MLKLFFASVFLVLNHHRGVSSVEWFHTYQGCNASFVCYHSFGVSANWSSSAGPLQQGSKVIIQNTNYYSVLTFTSVTTADNTNVSCKTNQPEALVFSLNVREVQCRDIFNTDTCKATVDGGDKCTNSWMIENCQKSCGLCPKFNCTESEQPTSAAVATTMTTTGSSTREISLTGSKAPSTSSLATETTTSNNNARENSSPSFNSCFIHLFVTIFLQAFVVTIA